MGFLCWDSNDDPEQPDDMDDEEYDQVHGVSEHWGLFSLFRK